MSTLFDFKSWCETNGLKKDTTNLLTEQDLNTKEAIVLITLHRVGRNKTGNYDDPWSAQTSTQSDRHVTKRLSKRGANRYGAPFVSKLFVNVMFNGVPTYPVKCSCDRMNQPSLFFTLISLYRIVMWHFLPWYLVTAMMYVTFSTLISFYCRDVTFSTLISFYCRDQTFSTLILFYYRDATFSSLISFHCRDEPDLFCLAEHFVYIVFIRPWSELVVRRWLGCARVPCIFCLEIVYLAYENKTTEVA